MHIYVYVLVSDTITRVFSPSCFLLDATPSGVLSRGVFVKCVYKKKDDG